jgi:serine/threonine protein kinase
MIQKLGKYQIIEKLGEGSMGAVYKAYDEVLDRYVAIKTMASDIRWNQELKVRFYREARSAAGLHHPNIVTIHDLGEENKTTFIVMELLTGRDLKTTIRERAPLTLQQKLMIIAQVGDGLNHAHNHQIIHRDIKPGNIYVSNDLNIKILDFGIAHIPSSELTRAGARLGTPFYMSPEQIRGSDCDERSDIFSAGIVFYELLTFVHPFFAKDMVKTMENIVFQAPLPFEEQLPGAPPGLSPILSGCLEKEPGKRFRSIGDVSQKCRQLIDEFNTASRKMCRELEALMPGLQPAIEQQQASAGQAQMYQEAKALLAQEATPDYIALQNLLSRISRECRPRIEITSSIKPGVPSAVPAPAPEEAEKTQILRSFAEVAKLEEPPSSMAPVQSAVAPKSAPMPSTVLPQASEIAPKPMDGEQREREAVKSSPPPLNDIRQETPAEKTQTEIGEATHSLGVQQREPARASQALEPSANNAPAADSKIETKPGSRRNRIVIGIAAAAVLLLVAGGIILIRSRQPKPVDLTQQISLAKASLSQSRYDQAISLSEKILAASPENAEASEILKQAQEKKKQLSIDALMLEAQNFRMQNLPEEAIKALKKALEIEPSYNPALGVLAQIEADVSATKTKEEQDKTIKEWAGKAAKLLSAGKINEANSEINKIARLRPDAPELLPLKKQLKDYMAAEAAHVQKEKEKEKERVEAQKQLRIAELREKASGLFAQGKYENAQAVLNEWLGEEPQNTQASSLRNQIGRAQIAIKDIEAAFARKNYAEALNAIALLQKINPSDPTIPALKKQIDERKTSARATFSVYRLTEPGTLFLDDQQIATGELENKVVSIGAHRLSVKSAQGKQNGLNLDLAEGQKVEFVYDASVPEIRLYAPADHALIEKRKLREQTYTYQVEHNHGALRGKCKGVLTISGTYVSFKTTETDHSFSYRFEQLKIVRSKERLEMSAQDNKKFTFTLKDAAKAEEANQIWDKLLQLAKD